MTRGTIADHLDRRADNYRAVLLVAALILVVTSVVVLLVPVKSHPAVHTSGPTLRWVGAGLAAAWGALDSVIAVVRRRRTTQTEHHNAVTEQILASLETGCANAGIASYTTRCSVVVWRCTDVTRRERRSGETRPALSAAYAHTGRGHVRSGLRWRVGMGVIGTSIETNTPLLVEVEPLWAPARTCTPAQWASQPDNVRQGLTHDQYLRADQANTPGSLSTGAPTVMAIPVFRGDKPLGCAALDIPAGMAAGLRQVSKDVESYLVTLGDDVLS